MTNGCKLNESPRFERLFELRFTADLYWNLRTIVGKIVRCLSLYRKHLAVSGMLYLCERHIIFDHWSYIRLELANTRLANPPFLKLHRCNPITTFMANVPMIRVLYRHQIWPLQERLAPFYVHRIKSRLYFTWTFNKYDVPHGKMSPKVRSVVEQFLRKYLFEHPILSSSNIEPVIIYPPCPHNLHFWRHPLKFLCLQSQYVCLSFK